MLRVISFAIAGLIAITSCGCVLKEIGQTVQQTVKGDYFLDSNQSERGKESFRKEVQENPDSALAHYYYGRFLLQENEIKTALQHLEKAGDLDADNADYQFWLGVASGANGLIEKEEKSYLNALDIDNRHLQSLIYLGHMRLNKKRYHEALDLYSQALEIWPGSPSALYNRALILNRLRRTPEERRAWLIYLNNHPSGAMAKQATEYLNISEDFSFRNHNLGDNSITIEKVRFIPFTNQIAESSYPSLLLVGDVFAEMKTGTLQIVTYQKNNKELAKQRAISIKQFILSETSSLTSKKIGVSWFSDPHQLTLRGRTISIDESVSFFVTAE